MLWLLCGHYLCQPYPHSHSALGDCGAEPCCLVLPGGRVGNGPPCDGAPDFTWRVPLVRNALPRTSPSVCVTWLLDTQTCSDPARQGARWAPGMLPWLLVQPSHTLLPGELRRLMLPQFPLLWLVSCSFCLQCPDAVHTGDIQGFASLGGGPLVTLLSPPPGTAAVRLGQQPCAGSALPCARPL